MAQEEVRRGWRGPPADYGADYAGGLEGQEKAEVQVCVGDRGETQSGFGGVGEVGAEV